MQALVSPHAASTIRRNIAAVGTAAQPHSRSVAALLFRFPFFQRLVNAIEEGAGDWILYPRRDYRVSDLADFFLHSKDITDAFVWRSRFAGASYLVPVDPAFPHQPPRNDPWGPATYWHRAANRKIREVYELVLRRQSPGTFLDVGTNWGNHTYPFAAHGYRCVCFEPQSICCRFIERMRALNGFTNITIVQAAVGARRETGIPFFESEVEAFSSMNESHVASFNVPFVKQTIDAITLDAYCDAHELTPSLIKIDAEGFEWEVVRGGLGILRRCMPTLLIEVSSAIDAQRAMWDALADAGYRCYWAARSSSEPFPQRPFVPIRDVGAFLAAGINTERFDTERDFVFVPGSDHLLLA